MSMQNEIEPLSEREGQVNTEVMAAGDSQLQGWNLKHIAPPCTKISFRCHPFYRSIDADPNARHIPSATPQEENS
jgi:hypothetical protein